MATYVTTIKNRKAVFTDDYIQIENLILYYNKMSNIRYKVGQSGFAFEYDGKNVLIPCKANEKDKMTPYFSKAVSLERQRKEKERELTLDDFTFNNLNTDLKENNLIELEPLSSAIEIPVIENISVNNFTNTQQTKNNYQLPNNSQKFNFFTNIQKLINKYIPIDNTKSFFEIGRLVIGIISIILFIPIVVQHCADGVSVLLGLFMLIGGIIGIITRKSTKKTGCIISALLCSIGSLFASLWCFSIPALSVWVIIAIIFSIFYIVCAVMNKEDDRERHVIGYISYSIIMILTILILLICGIANSTNTNTSTSNNPTESNNVEEVSEWATEVTPITDFEYTIDGDYIHLIKYIGKSKKIWVSAQYEVGNATYFTDPKMDALFEYSDDIYSIILPEGITTMDNNIFSGCEVEYLYIPKSLQSNNDNESFYDYLYNIKKIYYGGSEDDFNKLINNRDVTDEIVYNSSIPNLVGSAKTYQIQIPNIENKQEDIQEETYGKTYTLKGGELGDYGKKITLNKNTDDPNDVYLYKLPKGKYLVTTEGERVQFAVVKDETTTEDSEYPEILDYVDHPYLITGNSSNVNELVKKEVKIKLKKDESIYITGNDTITVKEIVSSGTKISQDKSKTETKKETKKEEIDPSIKARSAAVNYFSTIPWDSIFKYQYTIHYVAGLEVYEVANDDTDKWEASAPAEVQNGFGAVSNGRIYMYMDKDYNLTSIFYEGPNGTEKIY